MSAAWTERASDHRKEAEQRGEKDDDVVRLWEVDYVRRPRKGNGPWEKTCLWMRDEDCVGEGW